MIFANCDIIWELMIFKYYIHSYSHLLYYIIFHIEIIVFYISQLFDLLMSSFITHGHFNVGRFTIMVFNIHNETFILFYK